MSKYISSSDRLAERIELYQHLPLSMPLTIQIWVSDICNFRCEYCVQSQEPEIRDKHTSHKLMSLETYKKVIDNIVALGKIKKIMLFGNGEPLCHPDFAKMVQYAKEKNVADIVETFSNGALLTHELSTQLIDSGLDRLKISLQGLSADSYKKVAGVDIDYDNFVSEIEYFYRNRKECTLQIKIIDSIIPDESDKKLFYDTYGPICDELLVESLMNLTWGQTDVDDCDRAVFGSDRIRAKICSRPFFNLHIGTDGMIRPCGFAPINESFGNAAEDLKSVWIGCAYNKFLCSLLGEGEKPEWCKTCTDYSYYMMSRDVLDGHESELLERYKDFLKQSEQSMERSI